jgi:hypothetical protein
VAREISFDHNGWQLHSGRFLDENGDGVVDETDPQQLWVSTELAESLYDSTATLRRSVAPDAWLSRGVVGDVDPAVPGPEYGVLGSYERGSGSWDLVDGGTWTAGSGLPRGDADGNPWLADLDGDGTIELVAGASIRDARTGAWKADLQGLEGAGGNPTVISADLDGDGRHELATFGNRTGVQLFESTGALRGTCSAPTPGWTVTALAIGDLDGDPDGEVVAAGGGFVEICDADGTLLRSTRLDTVQTAVVGLGELDGDAAPEIVVGDVTGLVVLDDDLTVLFERGIPGEDWAFWPFALADLDGDGYHEIVVAEWAGAYGTLFVLGADGAVRGSLEGVPTTSSWMAHPLVTDLDADGRAEIVHSGHRGVVVVDDGAGGWDVPGADEAWSGPNKFPGDRDAWGGFPAAGAPHWATPERNVWQGLPTFRHPSADCP